MSKKNMLVCDDETDRARRWAVKIRGIEEVNAAFSIDVLEPEQFASAVTALLERQELARSGLESPADDAANVFDAADLLILDMDLTPLPGAYQQLEPQREEAVRRTLRGLSGETLAYFARCYSRVGYIVVVNQEYGVPTFDLTMEKFAESYADLNITSNDLVQENLWTGTPDGGYRPWHWPRLLDAPKVFEARVELAQLGRSVCEALGLSEHDMRALTAEQLDLFEEQTDPDNVTFEELVERAGSGLERKHEQSDPELRRRIAAGAMGRWLDRILLPAQNVLVDAPHLVQRYPHFLGDGMAEVGTWQATCDLAAATLPLTALPLSAPWADRPVWGLAASREATPILPSGEVQAPDIVFAEDRSAFCPFGAAKEFESNVSGPYSQRFCQPAEGVTYKPRQRLLG